MKVIMDHVYVDYDRHRAVDGVSLEVGEGEVLSLIGPNGSGKSTLIKCIAGILRPSSGRVLVNGRDVTAMSLQEVARLIGYVPQTSSHSYHSTVVDAVLLGRKPHIKWDVSRHDLKVVERSMAEVGVTSLAKKLLGQISGGEMQKVVIARALAQEPELFLFDEPTNNLDLKHQLEVLELARSLAIKKKSSTLLALHDLNLAFGYSDRVVMLNAGHIYASGKPEDVLTVSNIKDVFGVDVSILDSGQGRYILPDRRSFHSRMSVVA